MVAAGHNQVACITIQQERFGQMTRVYYKEASGAFVVFDVSRPSTFEAVIKWKQDLDAKASGDWILNCFNSVPDEQVTWPDGSSIPCVLLANKCDEEKAGSLADPQFLSRFCEENGFLSWFYTSPKGDSLHHIFRQHKSLLSIYGDQQKTSTLRILHVAC